MRPSVLPVLLVAVAVVGCSRPNDFGGFLVQQVTKYGGRTSSNAQLPKLDARWTVKRDKNGFQASVTDTSFGSVDTFMRQAFGAPRMSGFSTNIGQPYGTWAAVDIGVAIQIIGRPDGADVICVRGMSSMSEMIQEVDKPWWKKLW